MAKIKDDTKKKLIWTHGTYDICVLIPCKYKNGYLKHPIGHHVNTLSEWIDENIEYKGHKFVTVDGLDGYLIFEASYIQHSDMPIIEEQVIKPLSEYYGFDYEYIPHTEFMNLILR